MKLKAVLLLVGVFQSLISFSQQSWKEDYNRAKQVYQMQKYEIAMEYFLPVTSPDPSNAYASYAQYYYSLSAYKAGKYNEARQMLLQLLNRDPQWKQKNEAEYLLALVYFGMKQYRTSIDGLSTINGMEITITEFKQANYPTINPVDTLIKLQRIYSTDKELAKALFNKLATAPVGSKNNMLYEYLAQEFKFSKQTRTVEYVKKAVYNVAVIFPMNLNENLTDHTKNSYINDMYQGILTAVDSLKKAGVNVSLHVYDVDQDVSKMQSIISYPELKTMDLIIGPLHPLLIPYVTAFGEQNNIPVINPISSNSNIIQNTTKTLLFQPMLETIAGQTSTFAKNKFVYRKNDAKDDDTKPKTDVVIFYTAGLKDSLLATYYRDSVRTKGFTVAKFVLITKTNISTINKMFTDEISLNKVSHIFVASSEPALASNIVSALEITRLNIPVITKSEWLDINNQTYEQFERRQIYFIYPDYYAFHTDSYKLFKEAYIRQYNIYPSKYSVLGYELMSIVGNNMQLAGTGYFDLMRKTAVQKGHFMTGFDFSRSACNNYVPVYYFSNLKLTLANPIE